MGEKLAEIKKAIKEGTYKLDTETTAEKLVLLYELDLF